MNIDYLVHEYRFHKNKQKPSKMTSHPIVNLYNLISGLVVRGKNWLQFEIGGDAAAAQRHRFKAQELFMDTILSFIPTTLTYDEWHSKYNMWFSAFEAQCHILTKNKSQF